MSFGSCSLALFLNDHRPRECSLNLLRLGGHQPHRKIEVLLVFTYPVRGGPSGKRKMAE